MINVNAKNKKTKAIKISDIKKKYGKQKIFSRSFFKKLEEKAVLTKNSIISAFIPELMKEIYFIVEKTTEDGIIGKIINRNKYKVGEKNFLVSYSNITKIDDMKLARIAESLELDENGNQKKIKINPLTGLPVKRGRKPKKLKELIDKLKKEKSEEMN